MASGSVVWSTEIDWQSVPTVYSWLPVQPLASVVGAGVVLAVSPAAANVPGVGAV